ncbi:MAG: hypothetical protein EXQ96_08680 [Alphaproteobacteria bacterium]|nr:hypothetical protein [Alphaproteobacteria bacterium]
MKRVVLYYAVGSLLTLGWQVVAYDMVEACSFNPAPCPSRVLASGVNAALWPAYVVMRTQ